ncbi:hypothetical protein D3C85_1586790 [compost metagenome]
MLCQLSIVSASFIFGLTVLNAIKISPELLRPNPPVLATPKEARLAICFNCIGNKGASVANTTMMEPSLSFVVIIGLASNISFPAGTPEIIKSFRPPKFPCMKAPTVYFIVLI